MSVPIDQKAGTSLRSSFPSPGLCIEEPAGVCLLGRSYRHSAPPNFHACTGTWRGEESGSRAGHDLTKQQHGRYAHLHLHCRRATKLLMNGPTKHHDDIRSCSARIMPPPDRSRNNTTASRKQGWTGRPCAIPCHVIMETRRSADEDCKTRRVPTNGTRRFMPPLLHQLRRENAGTDRVIRRQLSADGTGSAGKKWMTMTCE